MSIGDALTQARSEAGLTIAQVSQRTRIRETIIRDIERGDFSTSGGDFYARGHIRSIARTVGIDPEALVAEYDATHGAPQPITAADVFEPSSPIKLREKHSLNWTAAMAIALVAVVAFGIYRAVAGGSPASHAVGGQPSHSAGPSASPSPSPSFSPAQFAHTVVIQLTALPRQDCWVGFYSTTGASLRQAYVIGGTTKTWKFHRAIVMKIGNPGGVLLTVNGQSLGKLGAVGQPMSLSLGPGQPLPSQPASAG